ncbi:MAG: 4-(cytidine 5'-diphospho)-2-C-methyl-D-erythritol kinase, partial [Chitinophagaceae bacterium]|nr:4-(cytidine 5'-diphospho)-2-C-methyl-D-erythritol kinase [Chitinophagaceae bacterium]
MICFPNGKINLGLRITEKRSDAYHNLDTVFVPLAIHDALEFQEATETSFFLSGDPVPGNPNDNFVVKALNLMRENFPGIPPQTIHLLKHIPNGAGMGGGSSDASFMIRALNETYSLNMNQDDMKKIALEIGSDCPFFIENKPCYGQSRGEVLTPLKLDLSEWEILVIKPGIHIPTSWAFQQIQVGIPEQSCREIMELPVSSWKNILLNDFEAPIFKQYPSIATLKDQLYAHGAVYASMSGSGSSLYGLFDSDSIQEAKTA